MADSLKDQLLKAGFKQTETAAKREQKGRKSSPAKNRRKGSGEHSAQNKSGASADQSKSQPGRHSGRNPAAKKNTSSASRLDATADPAAAAEKKRIKAAIKELIEESALKEFKGEIAYSYVLGNKVRQVFVNEKAHKSLSAGEVIITRLNGNTHLIPDELAAKILELNPDWAVVKNQPETDANPADGEYKDYKIPDDLNW